MHHTFNVDAPYFKKFDRVWMYALCVTGNAEAHHCGKVVYIIDSLYGHVPYKTINWFQTTEFTKVVSCIQDFFRTFLAQSIASITVGGGEIFLRLADNMDLIA